MRCAERISGRRLRRLVVVAGLACGLLLPAGAAAKLRAPHFSAEFAPPDVNGYSISVSGNHKSVQIAIVQGESSPKHLITSTYTFPGSSSANGIHADLGSFGTIAMQFKPSGEVRTSKFPKVGEGCDAPRKIVRRLGTFSGTFRFEGEGGYVISEASEVEGSVGTPSAILCGIFVGSGEGHRHHRHQAPPPSLGVTTTHNRLAFSAGFTGRHRKGAGFVASSMERHGPVSIIRWASVAGPSSGFQVNHQLTKATVSPPPPFSATATFERGPKGSRPSWSGSLSVSFPGREAPLTGSNFTGLILARF